MHPPRFQLSLLILSLSAISLSACQSTPSQISSNSTVLNTAPSWILHPPQDSPLAMYGVGAGKTRDEAIQNALADLTAKLGVTVQAKFTSQLSVKNRGFEWVKQDAQKTVSTQNEMLTLTNYEVVASNQPLPTQIHVLIKTDKLRLINDTQHFLKSVIHKAPWKQRNWSSLGVINQYQLAEKSLKGLRLFERQLALLKSLQPNQSVGDYELFIPETEQTFLTAQTNLSFEVMAKNASAEPFAQLLKQKLAQHQLLKPNANARLEVSTDENISSAYDFKIIRTTLTLKTYEQSTFKASQLIQFKGQGLEASQAQSQIQQRFQEELQQSPLLEILGISLPN